MAVERRQSVRVPVSMKVINESGQSNFGFGYAKNISTGGMALSTEVLLDENAEIKVGSNMRLKFKIPGGKLYITVDAEVTRAQKKGDELLNIGLKFTSLDEEFKKEIDYFVRQTEKGNLTLE